MALSSSTSTGKTNETREAGWKSEEAARKYARAEAVTRPFCRQLITQAGLRDYDSALNVLDLACGTGAATAALYETLKEVNNPSTKVTVFCGDIGPAMVEWVRERGKREGWEGMEAHIMDGQSLRLPSNTFTHVLCTFSIFMMPDDTLSKCLELLVPGGTLGITTWSRLSWYPLLARAISASESKPYLPSEEEFEARLFGGVPWQDINWVQTTMESEGFQQIVVRNEKMKLNCGEPSEFVTMMFMMIRMLSTFWEENDRERLIKEVTKALQEETEEEVQATDGKLYLVFEALVGTGRKASLEKSET